MLLSNLSIECDKPLIIHKPIFCLSASIVQQISSLLSQTIDLSSQFSLFVLIACLISFCCGLLNLFRKVKILIKVLVRYSVKKIQTALLQRAVTFCRLYHLAKLRLLLCQNILEYLSQVGIVLNISHRHLSEQQFFTFCPTLHICLYRLPPSYIIPRFVFTKTPFLTLLPINPQSVIYLFNLASVVDRSFVDCIKIKARLGNRITFRLFGKIVLYTHLQQVEQLFTTLFQPQTKFSLFFLVCCVLDQRHKQRQSAFGLQSSEKQGNFSPVRSLMTLS